MHKHERNRTEVANSLGPMLFWVISGKNAYQTYLMVLIMVSSITLMSGAADRVDDGIPNLVTQIFGGFLFVSGFISLLGVYWKGSLLTGLRLELTSCILLGLSSLVYGVFAAIASGYTSGVILTFLLTVASLGRFWQIVSAFRQVLSFKKEIASLTELD